VGGAKELVHACRGGGVDRSGHAVDAPVQRVHGVGGGEREAALAALAAARAAISRHRAASRGLDRQRADGVPADQQAAALDDVVVKAGVLAWIGLVDTAGQDRRRSGLPGGLMLTVVRDLNRLQFVTGTVRAALAANSVPGPPRGADSRCATRLTIRRSTMLALFHCGRTGWSTVECTVRVRGRERAGSHVTADLA
jgi:hypothetical protein